MATLLTYLLGLIVVGGGLFLLASFAFGRGEALAPMPPDGTPVELPDGRPVTGADVRGLRLSVVARGYRMSEVDWVLDQLAGQLDERDREIDRLRGGPVRPATGDDDTGTYASRYAVGLPGAGADQAGTRDPGPYDPGRYGAGPPDAGRDPGTGPDVSTSRAGDRQRSTADDGDRDGRG